MINPDELRLGVVAYLVSADWPEYLRGARPKTYERGRPWVCLWTDGERSSWIPLSTKPPSDTRVPLYPSEWCDTSSRRLKESSAILSIALHFPTLGHMQAATLEHDRLRPPRPRLSASAVRRLVSLVQAPIRQTTEAPERIFGGEA